MFAKNTAKDSIPQAGQKWPSPAGAAADKADATRWRRFLTDAPPMEELIEIRRLHDNKTILRRRVDLPPSFPSKSAEWRPV
jgi:hypothetical protein